MSEQVRQIAMRIKDLRELSDYTVAQMAEVCNLAQDDYVSYESGETDIPISFIMKLCEVFHVDMTQLLTGETPHLNTYSIVRAGAGKNITRTNHYIYKNLAYKFANRKIGPLYVTVPPHANPKCEPNSHEGQEFDYILEGTMRMELAGNEVILGAGDSIYYDSHVPHAMQCVGDEPVHFLAMVIPE